MDGIFILGSTAPLGEVFVKRLWQQARNVVVMHRSETRQAEFESLGIDVLRGDAMDPNEMMGAAHEAAQQRGTLMSFLGGMPFNDPSTWPDYQGNKNAFDAVRAAGFRRIIFITSIGSGNSWQYVPDKSGVNVGIMKLKSAAEDYLRAMDLDWTIIRPGGLGKPGSVPRTDTAMLTENEAVRGSIHREDLAELILAVLDDDSGSTFGKALSAVATKIVLFEGEAVPFTLG